MSAPAAQDENVQIGIEIHKKLGPSDMDIESLLQRISWLEDQRVMTQRDRVEAEHRFSRLAEHLERLRQDFLDERQQRQVESNEECMCRQAEDAALRASLEDVRALLRSALGIKMHLGHSHADDVNSSVMETFAEEPEDEKAPEGSLWTPASNGSTPRDLNAVCSRHGNASVKRGEEEEEDAAAMVECLEVRLESLEVHFQARLNGVEAQVGRRCDDAKAYAVARLDAAESLYLRRLDDFKASVGDGLAAAGHSQATAGTANMLQHLGQSVEQLEGSISTLLRSSMDARTEAKRDSAAVRADVDELGGRVRRLEAAEPPCQAAPTPPATSRMTSPGRPTVTRSSSMQNIGAKDGGALGSSRGGHYHQPVGPPRSPGRSRR